MNCLSKTCKTYPASLKTSGHLRAPRSEAKSDKDRSDQGHQTDKAVGNDLAKCGKKGSIGFVPNVAGNTDSKAQRHGQGKDGHENGKVAVGLRGPVHLKRAKKINHLNESKQRKDLSTLNWPSLSCQTPVEKRRQ